MIFGMLAISATWFLLLVGFCGIGFLFQKSLGIKAIDLENGLSAFWFGWCLVLMVLQIWHLFAPVGGGALLFVLALGAGGIIRSHRQIAEFYKREFKLWWILSLCLLVLWLANRAMAPIRPYDA